MNIPEKLLLFALGFGLAWALYFAWQQIRKNRIRGSLSVIDGSVPATVNASSPASIS